MQMGFNNDVEHAGRVVHIQTEDHGLGGMKITSQVFYGGAILDSKTYSYASDIEGLDDEARDERIRTLMKALHRKFYKRIHQGIYDEKLPPAATVPPADDAETAGLDVPVDALAADGFAVADTSDTKAAAKKTRGPALSGAALVASDSALDAEGFDDVVEGLAAVASGAAQSGFVQLGGVGSGSHTTVPTARGTAPSAIRFGNTRAWRGLDLQEDGFGALLLEVLEAP